MENKKGLIILFIIVNIVIWGFIILPKAFVILKTSIFRTIQQNPGFADTNPVANNIVDNNLAGRAQTSREKLERIDFYSLRDPFLPQKKLTIVKKAPKEPLQKKAEEPPAALTQPKEIQEEKYESRFRLKSIVQLKEKYIAALEEITHYGTESGLPYSYRFGDSTEQASQGPKSLLVMEGDSIMGESVYKITSDFVILTKNKKYFKLTFSGGYPINEP